MGGRGTSDETVVAILGRLDVAELSRAIVDAVREEVPAYRQLPAERVKELVASARRNLRQGVQVVVHHRPARDDEVAPLWLSAAARVQDGVPLEDQLAAYLLAAARTPSETSCAASARSPWWPTHSMPTPWAGSWARRSPR